MWWLGISIAHTVCATIASECLYGLVIKDDFLFHIVFFSVQPSRFSFKFMLFVKMCVCFFLFSSAVLSCIPRQSIVVCCIWCSILFGEKRLYFVALVAFRIRLRLGRVRFVLFVFLCEFHVVALFYTVFFFLVSIMHAKNTTTKHSKWWKKPIQFFLVITDYLLYFLW